MPKKVVDTQSIIEQAIGIVDREVKRLSKKQELEKDDAFVLNDYIKTLSSVQKDNRKHDKNQMIDPTRLTDEMIKEALELLKDEDAE